MTIFNTPGNIQAREHNGGVKRLKAESDYHKCNSVDPTLPLSEAYALYWVISRASFTKSLFLLESLAKMEGHSKSMVCFCSFECLNRALYSSAECSLSLCCNLRMVFPI